MNTPPSEFRRRALHAIADRSGAPVPIDPVDLQLGPMPLQEGGGMSSIDIAGLVGRAPPPGGAPPGAPPAPTGSVTSRDEGSDLDHIRTAIQALQLYAEGMHDDVELAKSHKCIVALQPILADDASNKDAAMGVTPALKHVRRVSGGGGY
jgi:hypothetical protein